MNRFSCRNLTLLALSMVAAPSLMAQELTGQMVGRVKTPAGEPVAGAEVRLTSPVLQGVRVLVTDERGAFRAPLLPPGSYTVAATKAGMVSNPIHGVTIGLGQTVNQDIPMASAQASAVVEVVGTAARVDKSDVKASTNVTSEDMDLLPRTTRGLNTVALLAPGVVQNTANGVNRIQIRGGQGTGNRFLLNGTDISDNAFGTTDGRQFFVDDSVAETQVIQSPVNARYGGFTGGVVNAITKVGGNEYTGVIRANISRPSWIANAPLGMRNAPANAKPAPGVDDASRAYTIWIGGPIVKDRLWFTASTKLDPSTGTTVTWANPALSGGTNTGDAAATAGPAYLTGAGGNHTQTNSTQFYELKLTGQINQNHTVEASGSRQVLSINNRQYLSGSDGSGSFDPATLNIGSQIFEYYSLGYRGILNNSTNLEARYSNKHQVFISGGDPANGPTIFARYSNGSYYQFNNGIFNITDGGDNRDIVTYMSNLQWFSPQSDLGSHQVDIGFEILRQERKAANDQAPTNQRFRVWGRNADGTYRAAGLAFSANAGQQNVYRAYFSDKGAADTNLDAYYVNDVWSITNRFQVSLGMRYDKVSASDTLGSKTISSTQTSPRTKFTYDIKGDQSWLVTASWARYTAKLQDGFANQFTLAGNPIQENYGWGGAINGISNNALTTAQVIDLRNWNISAAGLTGVSSPLTNTIDSKTKAPSSDETTVGLRRSYNDGSFLSFTYVKRTSKNFFNDFLYIQDIVNVPLRATAVPTTAPVLATRWGNDSRLVRDYKALEFEFASRLDANWNLGGNYTYSSLQGNGEGSEGNASTLAVTGDVIGDYESVHASRGRDASYYAPYGKLLGDRPHKATFHLDYSDKSTQGSIFTASLLFNYLSGAAYSLTRVNAFEVQQDAIAAGATPAFAAAQYGNTYTRYFGPRGIGRYNDTYNFDLKVGMDVPVMKTLRYFMELTFFNVFNHWQQTSYSIAGAAGSSALATNGALSGFQANALNTNTASSSYGTGFGTYGAADMVGGRSVVLSTGIKW
ncbi:hypothetical protein GETHLI_20480 [Geothrix limicola]|uniref:TonB-dependent receptor plug domain-containing protein n=1 Tax=Geothrix limicola TaxID=2927978 RepID=A0ABQ5QG90_9BACT|nr:TonB-dependent receptor [Geothrix limicola]GLH73546.1 hypothetical protein GETHLI_20480 [Geothrix limicola]